MRVLLALAAALTTFAVAWLTQDWFNTILSKLPLTLGGPARVTDMSSPWRRSFHPLVQHPRTTLRPHGGRARALCGCGIAVAAQVLVVLAVLCGRTSGGLWIYRRS
ncbi:MAG: hypothetical protein F4Z82_00945 [Caldilineaceae bacterium SB0668_bin_21]|nr:hypothetical protein [Caldilineaceae bacterium SB0668_bin_21]MYC24203.1 hypothetical protein [Caldilineaceae bacterium SB0662_bin_25]